MEHIAISVIVPIYNTKPYLAECIESILDQKINVPIEVLLIDDGSTDGTGDMLRERYGERYRWLALFTVAIGVIAAVLATTSLNDTRVEVTEPAKWVAQLRRTVSADDARPILLRTELVAGHGGVSGRYQAWRDLAFELAWIIDQVAPERAE